MLDWRIPPLRRFRASPTLHMTWPGKGWGRSVGGELMDEMGYLDVFPVLLAWKEDLEASEAVCEE